MVGGRHREFGQPDRSGHDCARTGDRMRASIGPIPKWGLWHAAFVDGHRIERRKPGGQRPSLPKPIPSLMPGAAAAPDQFPCADRRAGVSGNARREQDRGGQALSIPAARLDPSVRATSAAPSERERGSGLPGRQPPTTGRAGPHGHARPGSDQSKVNRTPSANVRSSSSELVLNCSGLPASAYL